LDLAAKKTGRDEDDDELRLLALVANSNVVMTQPISSMMSDDVTRTCLTHCYSLNSSV